MSLNKYDPQTKTLTPIAGGFDVAGIINNIGDLSDLQTTTKSSLVAAVNEVNTNKVDKVEGKGLSTNDYSDTEKGKVTDNTSAIEAMVNVNGSKNILPNKFAGSTQTKSDITYTIDDNGVIDADGTSTSSWATLSFVEYTDNIKIPKGTYILSGCTGGSFVGKTYYMKLFYNTTPDAGGSEVSVTVDTEPVQFTIEQDMYIRAYVTVETAGTVLNHVKFYPMLRDARIKNPAFVPYAMTNRALTVDTTVLTVTPLQSDYLIPYPDGFTLENSMIISAQYKSSTRGFVAFDPGSSTFPMPYYHNNGIAVNPSNVDTTLYTKLVLCLKKIR